MIVAVVLTFAAPEGMLEDCVASVTAAELVDHVVVVDNGTLASARLAAGERIEVVVTGENLGFAGGMNVGIARALALGADAVLVLNDDLVIEPDAVRHLVDELGDPDGARRGEDRIGAVQAKLLFTGSDPPRINSVGVELGRDGAGRDIGIDELDGTAWSSTRSIEVFTGGAVLLAGSFLRDVALSPARWFDDRYFLYYEDVDLSLRGREQGWSYRCAGRAVVWHRGSASTLHEGVRLRTIYLRERNRLWVLIRHRPARHIACGLWLSVRRVRWSPRGLHLRALLAGVGAAPRLLVERRRARRPQR